MTTNADSIAKNDIRARQLSWFSAPAWRDTGAPLAHGADLDADGCDQATHLIADDTIEDEDVNEGLLRESWLHTWEDKDGYYYCFSGITLDGLSCRSEDVGPFDTRADARRAAYDVLESVL